jgi:hypothetical protein
MSKIMQSIQSVDFPPPRAGRNFLIRPEKAEILIDQRDLAGSVMTVPDASRRNDSETRRIETGNIRGICSLDVLARALTRARGGRVMVHINSTARLGGGEVRIRHGELRQ